MLTVSALCGAILFSAALSRRRERLSDIAFYIPLFLLVTVTNPLFSHNGQTPLFFLNGNAVTLEALFYGVGLAVAVCGVMLWCKCFGKIMTADKTLYLFGKTLRKSPSLFPAPCALFRFSNAVSKKSAVPKRRWGFILQKALLTVFAALAASLFQ